MGGIGLSPLYMAAEVVNLGATRTLLTAGADATLRKDGYIIKKKRRWTSLPALVRSR